jgi:hypothetical protein
MECLIVTAVGRLGLLSVERLEDERPRKSLGRSGSIADSASGRITVPVPLGFMT